MAQSKQSFEWAKNNIEGIARSWADYGLTVGKSALNASAETLRSTAAFLDGLSEKISNPQNAEVQTATDNN